MVKFLEKIKDGLTQGLSFGIGLFLFVSVLFGVYAFVEPSVSPTVNNVMSSFTQSQSSLTANNGGYDNRIASGSFPAAYTEVCFKGGSTLNDQHLAGESTDGGNCLTGDVGYIIEKEERTATYWELAKQICLENNMRLLEPFEYKLSCKEAIAFSLNSMTGNWEWVSNFALPMYNSNTGVGAAVMGGSGCNYSGWDWVGTSAGSEASIAFRCAK